MFGPLSAIATFGRNNVHPHPKLGWHLVADELGNSAGTWSSNPSYQIHSDPVVAANVANGQFLVAWSADDDGPLMVNHEYEIFVQRMDGLAIFVDGFETGDTTNWDVAP